jgi:hypothetical protein
MQQHQQYYSRPIHSEYDGFGRRHTIKQEVRVWRSLRVGRRVFLLKFGFVRGGELVGLVGASEVPQLELWSSDAARDGREESTKLG